MHLESYRAYCLAKPGVTEEFPFDDKTLVYKVMGKMFAACDVDLFESVNLKGLPEDNLDLREQYPGIQPGYHMNKKHWNTVACDGSVPDNVITKLTDESYRLVSESLPRKLKIELEGLSK
jgi:predicted DNA-binding protein (MmcQ/YjbR family)